VVSVLLEGHEGRMDSPWNRKRLMGLELGQRMIVGAVS